MSWKTPVFTVKCLWLWTPAAVAYFSVSISFSVSETESNPGSESISTDYPS